MTRMVFASCMSTEAGTRTGCVEGSARPSAGMAILGGDNIYMDYWPNLNQSKRWTLEKFRDEDFHALRPQLAVKSFRALVNSIPAGQVIGVWDDHDFAWNNCYGTDTGDGMPDKQRIGRPSITTIPGR